MKEFLIEIYLSPISFFIMPMTSPKPTFHEENDNIEDQEEDEDHQMLMSAFDGITSSSGNDHGGLFGSKVGDFIGKGTVKACCLFNGGKCERIGSSRVCNVSQLGWGEEPREGTGRFC